MAKKKPEQLLEFSDYLDQLRGRVMSNLIESHPPKDLEFRIEWMHVDEDGNEIPCEEERANAAEIMVRCRDLQLIRRYLPQSCPPHHKFPASWLSIEAGLFIIGFGGNSAEQKPDT